MTRSLAARLDRLEARHKATNDKPKGLIGGRFNGSYIEEIDGVLYSRREEPPDGFAVFARNQQAALQAELSRLFADMAAEGDAPGSVGTESLAPWPEKRKRPKFVEIEGFGEIEIGNLKGFTRK